MDLFGSRQTQHKKRLANNSFVRVEMGIGRSNASVRTRIGATTGRSSFSIPTVCRSHGKRLLWLLRRGAIDLWMLYPTGMGLNRLLTKDGEIPVEWQQTLDRSLGCTDWRDAFYRVRTTPNLFGDPRTELVKDANTEKFEAFLLDRLRTIFAGVLAKSLPLRNSKGQVMYLLCFAIGNPRGVQLAMRIASTVIKGRRR
jgi:hypothetical protein